MAPPASEVMHAWCRANGSVAVILPHTDDDSLIIHLYAKHRAETILDDPWSGGRRWKGILDLLLAHRFRRRWIVHCMADADDLTRLVQMQLTHRTWDVIPEHTPGQLPVGWLVDEEGRVTKDDDGNDSMMRMVVWKDIRTGLPSPPSRSLFPVFLLVIVMEGDYVPRLDELHESMRAVYNVQSQTLHVYISKLRHLVGLHFVPEMLDDWNPPHLVVHGDAGQLLEQAVAYQLSGQKDVHVVHEH